MAMTEEQLQELITRICENPDLQSAKRRKDIERLLRELQQLSGLIQSSHLLYLEALDQTWLWVSNHICNFERQPNLSIKESLKNWINGYLKRRIQDLYINQAKQQHDELSLDIPIHENSENPLTFLEQLSDNSFNAPTLSGIDSYIEKCRNINIQVALDNLEHYVEEDPEHIFQNCHPRKNPNCNCKFLCQKLVFQYPPDTFANISRELEINYDTLRSFWKRKCLPLLQQKLEELGYSRDE
ncbi:hypothetical protein [Dapis sp. BLCC M126]|uniref:hypothetical protein n=1 Tax=Dapis sp. BLCC M126 TaxID=3400189 RepID=UPI003CF77E46